MTTTAEHAGLVAVAAASSVGVTLVNGVDEGKGAAVTAAAVMLSITWIRFGRPWLSARRGATSDEVNLHAALPRPTHMTVDDCISALLPAAVISAALRYVGDHPAADGALTVSLFVALSLFWTVYGTRWLERRKVTKASASS